MGITVVNVYGLTPHSNPGDNANTYSVRHHYGNGGIDDTSPSFTHAAALAVKDAAINGSQADFNAACQAATGSGWWNDANRSGTFKAELKANIARSV